MKILTGLLISGILFFTAQDWLPEPGANMSGIVNVAGEMQDGSSLYQRHCISCHQADGSGVPSMYPALDGNERVNGDPEPLIKVLLMGENAPFSVDKDNYMGAMASYKYLSDEKVADILTYIRSEFSNDAPAVSPDMVKEVRKKME